MLAQSVPCKFSQKNVILRCFPKCREGYLFRTRIFLTFIYCDIKHILRRSCLTEHLPRYRWTSWLEDKHTIFIEEGVVLWFSTAQWHSVDNERSGPFGHTAQLEEKGMQILRVSFVCQCYSTLQIKRKSYKEQRRKLQNLPGNETGFQPIYHGTH